MSQEQSENYNVAYFGINKIKHKNKTKNLKSPIMLLFLSSFNLFLTFEKGIVVFWNQAVMCKNSIVFLVKHVKCE